MEHAGGMFLPPVQTLVATIIFATGESANESLASHAAKQPNLRFSLLYYLITTVYVECTGENANESTAGHAAKQQNRVLPS